jgi:hypothetical protein
VAVSQSDLFLEVAACAKEDTGITEELHFRPVRYRVARMERSEIRANPESGDSRIPA